MWNFKRVMILLGGLVVFLFGYMVYAYFLGGIDGLPLLPEHYVKGPIQIDTPPPPPAETDKMMKMAFGAECEELRRPIKLFLRSKGVLLASNQFDIEPDGRVKLSPLSAALFPKTRGEVKYPEINTVQCELAFLTLDRPVSSLTELSNRKVIGVELRGNRGITMINNRRTAEKNDDIELLITNGPMYYEERKNLIWTDGYVQLLDTQTQPHPTRITAKGMELKLAEDTGPNRPKGAKTKGKGENVTGVDMALLKANVDMHLWVDAASGFLAGAEDFGKKTPGPKTPQEKSHVIIKTNGPFHYDLNKELAWFDSPSNTNGSPEQVLVSREHKLGDGKKYDQLLCDRLELQFRKKQSDAKTPRDPRTGDKEIETALATTRPGREVVLTMDTENLEAYGLELHYRCAGPTTGPQTILKGNPLHAIQNGHKIEARELHLIGPDKQGNGQQAFAKGPGQIDLYDKGNPRKPYPTHALWEDSLIAVKERDGDKVLDVLTMTGNASFIDEEHKQELHGQRLQIWLEGAAPERKKDVKATTVARQKPHKIEAFDKVVMRSPEIIIKHTNHLKVCIRHEAATDVTLPEKLPMTPQKGAESQPPETPKLAAPIPEPKGTAGKGAVATTNLQNPKNKRPIELTANDVVAYISSQGSKKQLQELVTEGAVHVRQEGENPKDKGIDITGEMLNLIHHNDGDLLYVYGDARKAARLQLGELILIGPKVTINQKDNMAEVEGAGAMSLPGSNTTFDGAKTTKADTRLEVHWNKDMLFDGKDAQFYGGVQAYQDTGSMKCNFMQVTLDKTVSFKQGQKEKQNAKAEKVVCHQKVLVLDEKRDPAGKLIVYDSLEAHELALDNQESFGNAYGPGVFVHLGLANAESPLAAPGQAPGQASKGNEKAEQEMRKTQIDYEGRMFFKKKDNSRNAKFYGNVEVFHWPTDDPSAKMNADKPPKNGFYLRSNFLDVYTRVVDGKSSQEMKAEGAVFFRTDEFFGRSHIAKFDEAQNQVIFEGTPGNPATLFKKKPNGETQEIKANKILYNRKTGAFHLDGGKVIQSRLDRFEGVGMSGGVACLEGSCRRETAGGLVCYQSPLQGWTRTARINRSRLLV